MNVKVVFADMTKEFCCYEKYLNLVSEKRQQRIANYRFNKDKIISLLTEILFRREISRQLNLSDVDIFFKYNKYDKPYLGNREDYHFSVSHSGNCIVFITNNAPIGIDVEEISDAKFEIAKRFFTENECNFIENSKKSNVAFYKIWTAKEAYVKMLGVGLSKSFCSFDVLSGEIKSKFLHQQISNYIITVCSEEFKDNTLNIEEVSVESLLK